MDVPLSSSISEPEKVLVVVSGCCQDSGAEGPGRVLGARRVRQFTEERKLGRPRSTGLFGTVDRHTLYTIIIDTNT
jgi:hypothetical protein